MTEIKLKNGVVLHNTGEAVWMREPGEKGWTNLGYVYKLHWNFHDIGHVSWNKDGRLPVPQIMVRMAERFRYKHLRLEFMSTVRTPRGRRLKVEYGYISIAKLARLAKKRTVVKGFQNMNYILLRKTDLELMSR